MLRTFLGLLLVEMAFTVRNRLAKVVLGASGTTIGLSGLLGTHEAVWPKGQR